MTQEIFHWLAGIPGLENLEAEQLGSFPGCAGLFTRGQQLLWERADILGSRLRRRKLSFLLAVVAASGSVNPLENLEERALGSAPTLGEAQTVAMEKARLIRDSGNGLARFQTEITFTFTTKEV